MARAVVLETVGDSGLVVATSSFISAAAGATAIGAIVAGGSVPARGAAPATAVTPLQTTPGQTVQGGSQGALTGIVMTPDGQLLANIAVRARDPVTEAIGGSTTTLSGGQFAIDVAPGRYVLEVVDDGGLVVATSVVFSAAAGATVTRALVARGVVPRAAAPVPAAAQPQSPVGDVADGAVPQRGAAQVTAATATSAILEETVLDASQGMISGIVTNPGGQVLANTGMRARNVLTDEIGGSTITESGGQFAINVTPGSYVLEIDDAGGVINGTVMTPEGEPLANTGIRARNLLTGEIGGTTTTGPGGQFAINVTPGSYVLEIVDSSGLVVATSAFVAATAGATVTTAAVAATTTALGVVTGATSLISAAMGVAAGATSLAAATGVPIPGIPPVLGAGGGVPGIVVPPDVPIASPSR